MLHRPAQGPTHANQLLHDPVTVQDPLGVGRCGETAHLTLRVGRGGCWDPSARLFKVLGRVVGDTGHDVPRGPSGAAPRVGHETTRGLSLTLQACSEASLRRPPVPTGVDEKVTPVTVQGQRRSLWRAVDHEGDVLDSLVQAHRDCRAATRLFRTLLQGQRRVRRGGWAPTRCAATGLHTERSCHPSPSARTDTRTIVPTSPTSPHGTARDTCAGSTFPGRHNDSCPCMDSSAPSSAMAVTWCERCIIGNYEDALFSLGMLSRPPPDSNCDHDPECRRARRTLP